MQEKNFEKDSYFIEKSVTNSIQTEIREKFWSQKPKSQAKIEDKQK